MLIVKLLENLANFLTGLVTRLVSGNNGLTKAGRERLLTLVILIIFFGLIQVTSVIVMWLTLKR